WEMESRNSEFGSRRSEVGGRTSDRSVGFSPRGVRSDFAWAEAQATRVPLASEAKRSRPVRARQRTAFTLVELLVVITIIIILMGLLTPVIWIAVVNAREARIKTEIPMLASAVNASEERLGSS